MPDYGHDLAFGALLGVPDGNPQGVLELADLIDEVGLDVVSLADHPYWPERLDTIALLTAILTRTSRVRVLSNCFNLPLRPPNILARTAATLDILSGGRFELGLAAGAQPLWPGILAEGGPSRTAGESITALEEAVTIIRALWSEGPDFSFDGNHYHLDGAQRGPVPTRDIPLWLGAYQPRMLRVTGTLADAWIPSTGGLAPNGFAAANTIIDEAAVAAGRRPADVRRGYNIGGAFSDTAGGFAAATDGFLQGPPKTWAEQLAELTLADGVSVYLLYQVTDESVIRTFADEVAPAVREIVAAERARTT